MPGWWGIESLGCIVNPNGSPTIVSSIIAFLLSEAGLSSMVA